MLCSQGLIKAQSQALGISAFENFSWNWPRFTSGLSKRSLLVWILKQLVSTEIETETGTRGPTFHGSRSHSNQLRRNNPNNFNCFLHQGSILTWHWGVNLIKSLLSFHFEFSQSVLLTWLTAANQSFSLGAVVVAQLVDWSHPTPEIRGSNLKFVKILSTNCVI